MAEITLICVPALNIWLGWPPNTSYLTEVCYCLLATRGVKKGTKRLPRPDEAAISKQWVALEARLKQDPTFASWLGGVMDGDGSLRHPHQTVICVHIDELPILVRIKKMFQFGKFYTTEASPNCCTYQIDAKHEREFLLKVVNGHIRVRKTDFMARCEQHQIPFKEAEAVTLKDAYFAGLVDTDGSVFFDKHKNRIHVTVTNKSEENLSFLPEGLGLGMVAMGQAADPARNQFETHKFLIRRLKEVEAIGEYFLWLAPKGSKPKPSYLTRVC